MVRQGFGQGSDYSGLFASLWNEDQSNRERLARDLERRNDERQSAKDSEVFSKFDHGDLSGAELLAYIRQRVSDTAHDPQENAKWKDALRDYTESIADQAAEDAYAAGGSIHQLIAYYQNKQGSAAKGSPEYSQTQKRLYELIDQAASDDMVMGAQRIVDKIARGEASLQDLADFYKRQMRSLRPNSPLRAEVQAQLSSVQNDIIKQNTDSAAAKIDFQFKAGQISGVEANRQLTSLAGTYQTSDPTRYWQMLEQGQSYLEQANQTAIPNLAALSGFGSPSNPNTASPGGGGRSWDGKWIPNTDTSGGFRFVTQLDGSTFAKKNCVFASGAMLAQAMGVSNLSGGDLRWMSGDNFGGSDWGHLRRAMSKAGLGVEVARGLTFNGFTQKLANGQPAVVGGNTARLPDSLRGEYLGGHAIYVDRYDPEKGYLVFNPAKRNTQGQWWSPEVMQAFAWGGKTMDSAVFAPKDSIVNPGSRPVPGQISVWDPPKRSDTPRNYGVGNDPGVEGRSQTVLDRAGIKPSSQTDSKGNPRPYDLGLPTTQDEVAEQREKLQVQQERAVRMSQAFADGDAYFVEADGTHTPLTQQSILAESQTALHSLDYGAALAYAVNDPDAADKIADARAALTNGLLSAGDTRQHFLWNQILNDVGRRFAYSEAYDTDPGSAAAVVVSALTRLKTFGAKLDANQPDQPEAVTSPFKTDVQAVIDNLTIAADPNADAAARQTALAALPDSFTRNLGLGAQATVDAATGVANGTMVQAIAVPRDGNGRPTGNPQWTVVPAQQDSTGKTVPATDVPTTAIIVDGRVVFAELTDVPTGDRQIALTGNPAAIAALLPKNNPVAAALLKYGPNQIIPTSFLSSLTPFQLAQLQQQSVITVGAPVTQRGVVIPAGVNTPAQTWVQDSETLLWYKDHLPTVSKPDSLGLGTVETGTNGATTVVWKPGEVGQGVYLPFSGDPVKAQQALDSGAAAPYIPPVRFRDSFGVLTDDPAFSPDARRMFDKSVPAYSAQTGFNLSPAANRWEPTAAQSSAASSVAPSMGANIGNMYSDRNGLNASTLTKDLATSLRGLGISSPLSTPNVNAQTGFTIPAPAVATARATTTKANLPVVTLPKPSTTKLANLDYSSPDSGSKSSYVPPAAPKVTVPDTVTPYRNPYGERGL